MGVASGTADPRITYCDLSNGDRGCLAPSRHMSVDQPPTTQPPLSCVPCAAAPPDWPSLLLVPLVLPLAW